MNRRNMAWFVATGLLTLVVGATAPAFPMVQGDTDPEPPAEATGEDPEASRESVEDILRQQEQLIREQRFTYDPGGRREQRAGKRIAGSCQRINIASP